MEARWLVIRALGISLTALVIGVHLPPFKGWMPAVAALGALVVYGIPTEIGRVLATRNPERAAPLLLQLVRPIELLFAPLAWPIVLIGRLFEHKDEARPTPAPGLVESEVEMLVNEGELSGELGHEQSEMIRNVLDFGDITAGQLMVPRTQVHAIEIDTPIAEVLTLIAESEHSRYPVYRENIDNVVGVLHSKDLLPPLARGDLEKIGLPTLVRQPVVFVPESQAADSVLREMRAGKQHLAVVLDEFGGTSGILTLENLLEQIVGDIRDEHDVEEPPIADLGDGKLLVDASVSIAVSPVRLTTVIWSSTVVPAVPSSCFFSPCCSAAAACSWVCFWTRLRCSCARWAASRSRCVPMSAFVDRGLLRKTAASLEAGCGAGAARCLSSMIFSRSAAFSLRSASLSSISCIRNRASASRTPARTRRKQSSTAKRW